MITEKHLKDTLSRHTDAVSKTYEAKYGKPLSWQWKKVGAKVTERVSGLLTAEEAEEVCAQLKQGLPSSAFIGVSRVGEGERCYRARINLDRLEADITIEVYLNTFINGLRTFPTAQWTYNSDGTIQAVYPIENQKYFRILEHAFRYFQEDVNFNCFEFLSNEKCELVVVGNIENIRTMMDHHKVRCLHIMREYLNNIDGISDIMMYASAPRFESHYSGLMISNTLEGGMPGITFSVRDSDTYLKAQEAFPDCLEQKANGYINTGNDENKDREIGIRAPTLDVMAFLVTQNMYKAIHEAREEYCAQVWSIKTKGSINTSNFATNLGFFPRDIMQLIARKACPGNAFLTIEEAVEMVKNIEEYEATNLPSIVV